MKTPIDLDNQLLADAMLLGEWPTKTEAANEALVMYVRNLKRASLLALKGKLPWDGDLGEIRAIRPGTKAQ